MTLCIICIFIGVYGRVVGASPRGPQPRQVIVGKWSSGTLLRIIGILSTEYSSRPELILFNRGITGKFEGRKAISAFVALRATNQIPLCYMVDITNWSITTARHWQAYTDIKSTSSRWFKPVSCHRNDGSYFPGQVVFSSRNSHSSAGAMNIYINLMGIQPQDIVSITADGRIYTLVYILHTFKPQKKRRKWLL